MKLIITNDHRFSRTPDGRIWTQVTHDYSIWCRYLDVFDKVQVIARVQEVESVTEDHNRADGQHVSFIPLPCYIGPEQYLLNLRELRGRIRSSYSTEACYLARVPSQISNLLLKELDKRKHPYGLDVATDPYSVFAPNAIRHPLRPFFRWWFYYNLRTHCASAVAATYVTNHTLQQRYPCPGFSIGISTVDLRSEAYIDQPRRFSHSNGKKTVVFVGSLAQMYKAPDILIEAISACIRKGIDLQLVIVGDGRYRSKLEQQIEALELVDKVVLLGQLQAGEQVRDQLDKSDLFVLPSYAEGLPRAMLEAMARGLPCIGTNVGGIPEILSEENMVSPGDAIALANKIEEVLRNPKRLSIMSESNLKKAKEYDAGLLQEKRRAFCEYLRNKTESW